MADQAVPEQQKGPGRFKKLTKTILVLFKGKATKYSVMTAADIKSRGPELAAILYRTIGHFRLALEDWPDTVKLTVSLTYQNEIWTCQYGMGLD